MKGWQTSDINRLQERGMVVINTMPPPPKREFRAARPSKYGNIKQVVDGIEFDSIREAKRYTHLKILLKAGEIGLLECQVEFELNKGGTHSLKYVADFVYVDAKTGNKIVEDCKGFRTAVYRKKKRLMKKVYGIEIFET